VGSNWGSKSGKEEESFRGGESHQKSLQRKKGKKEKKKKKGEWLRVPLEGDVRNKKTTGLGYLGRKNMDCRGGWARNWKKTCRGREGIEKGGGGSIYAHPPHIHKKEKKKK